MCLIYDVDFRLPSQLRASGVVMLMLAASCRTSTRCSDTVLQHSVHRRPSTLSLCDIAFRRSAGRPGGTTFQPVQGRLGARLPNAQLAALLRCLRRASGRISRCLFFLVCIAMYHAVSRRSRKHASAEPHSQTCSIMDPACT